MFDGLQPGSFVCTAADPAWDYTTRSIKGRGRSPKYPTMSLADIAALPVGEYAAPDALLWLWITGPFLAIGAHIPVMKAWGFTPSSMAFIWLKPTKRHYHQGQFFLDDRTLFRMMQGHTTRQNVEYVILGRRGNPPKRKRADIRQVIVEPIREHSRKPDIFFDRVEQYCDGPRLELFSRAEREGWTCRGNQLGTFPKAA